MGNVTSQILVEGFISEIRNSVIEFNFTDEIDLNDICSSDIFKSLSALISIKSNHAEEDEDEVMWSNVSCILSETGFIFFRNKKD